MMELEWLLCTSFLHDRERYSVTLLNKGKTTQKFYQKKRKVVLVCTI